MHRILSISLTLILLAFFTGAGKIKDAGEFSWNKTTHDFDRIPRGQAYTYRFTFSNAGDESITISSVTSSSTFASAKWSTQSVRPLQSGYVDVTFTPVKAGPEMVSFTVKSNSSTPVVTLWIKGEVMTATN